MVWKRKVKGRGWRDLHKKRGLRKKKRRLGPKPRVWRRWRRMKVGKYGAKGEVTSSSLTFLLRCRYQLQER